MKSLSRQRAKRKANRPVQYTDFGIPVFLSGAGVPPGMRHFAPDMVNWLDEPGRQQGAITESVLPVPSSSIFSKHTGNAIGTDPDFLPGPA
ncbi:MAG: hypothetical protein IT262_09645 [Saprospiraceae bacterium]|nr:hypothetical protein [Saprospiraceae bacterium]